MDGIKLDYQIVGQSGPIIVFENGLGGHYLDWSFVVNEICTDATAILYHRAGYGNSRSSISSRTTEQIAKELKQMLDELGIKNNIILVGHSFGGLCVQHFARLYPEQVKAVILVDSTSADFNSLYSLNLPTLFNHIAIDKLIDKWRALSDKTDLELLKLMEPVLSEEQLGLPREFHKELEEFSVNPTTYGMMAMETAHWTLSSQQIKNAKDFPDIPLYAIARDLEKSVKFYTDRGIPAEEAEAYEATWRHLQIAHSKLTNKGKLIVAHGSDHNVQLEKPEFIINCIRELI